MSVVLEKPFARGEEFTEEVAAEQLRLQTGGMSAERAKVKAVDTVAAANNMTGEALELYLTEYRQYLAAKVADASRQERKNGTQNGTNGATALPLFSHLDEPYTGEIVTPALDATALDKPNKRAKAAPPADDPIATLMKGLPHGEMFLMACADTVAAQRVVALISDRSKWPGVGWRRPGPKPEGRPGYATKQLKGVLPNGRPCVILRVLRHPKDWDGEGDE